jgi:hypothetical protein
MAKNKRGGLTLKSGKVGRVNCLRQQLLMPGERMDVDISGKVRMEALRERDVMRINAHLGIFLTPVRWLYEQWPDYVKQGPDTVQTIPLLSDTNLSKYGVGTGYASATNYYNIFSKAVLKCYNEHYKWPEDPDKAVWDDDGEPAVPLSSAWSRCRYDATPDETGDYQVSSATNFDVRELAKTQARFRSAMKRDVLSYNRWMELVQEMWNGDGSREVDQVPMLIDQVEVGVNPRELPATDGASLGNWQSLYDFNINHSLRGIIAPEHCVLTYLLTVRFGPMTESIMPLATQYNDWWENVADPEYLASEEPQSVTIRELFPNTSTTSLGYLPAGWKWRCEHNVIGTQIDAMDTFPYMEQPTTQSNAKDATRVKNAFRSNRLGDYVADVYFNEESKQPIGTAMDSYFSGMIDDVKGKYQTQAEFPKGGKML